LAIERNAVIDLFWKVHPKVYRWSGGRIGGSMRGIPILLLTTTGRKSGQPRTKALMYISQADNFVVAASFLGSEQHPAWWLNLISDPDATVQIDGTSYDVKAREAEGEEREELWSAFVDMMAEYDEYRAQTSRRIPVVVLERQ
jgi:deazaflavin-dependent oxidoreductase (nitroreductase family)